MCLLIVLNTHLTGNISPTWYVDIVSIMYANIKPNVIPTANVKINVRPIIGLTEAETENIKIL